MKYIKLILIPVFLLALSMSTYTQTVDEILSKHIDALGGMDKITSIQTARVTGNSGFGSMNFPFTVTFKPPNSMLMETTIQQMTMKQGYDGTTAWMVNPFMGVKDPQKLNEEQTKAMKEEADFYGPLINPKDKGYTIELIGKEDMEGSDTYKLKATSKDGDVSYYYIDASNYLILKTSTTRKIKEKEIEISTYYSDYKSEDGFMMSHSVVEKGDFGQMGDSQKITFDKVEFNIPVDDSIFKMPETK